MAGRKKKKFNFYGDYGSSQVFPGSGTSSTRRSSGGGRRREEAPYIEVGGGNPYEACDGSGIYQRCNGTSWYTLRNGTQVRCKACEPRGPRASEDDRGKCWPCHGSGKERPTRYRRDGN